MIDILRHRPEKKVHSHKAIPFFWNLLRKRMVATLMLHWERSRAKQPKGLCITYFLPCTAYDFGEGHLLQKILAVRTRFGALAPKFRYVA